MFKCHFYQNAASSTVYGLYISIKQVKIGHPHSQEQMMRRSKVLPQANETENDIDLHQPDSASCTSKGEASCLQVIVARSCMLI